MAEQTLIQQYRDEFPSDERNDAQVVRELYNTMGREKESIGEFALRAGYNPGAFNALATSTADAAMLGSRSRVLGGLKTLIDNPLTTLGSLVDERLANERDKAYASNKQTFQDMADMAAATNPLSSLAGNVLGYGAQGLAAAPALARATAGLAGAPYAQAAAQGAALAGADSAARSAFRQADTGDVDLGKVAIDTTIGAGIGAGAGMLGQGIADVTGKYLLPRINRSIDSSEAKAMAARGAARTNAMSTARKQSADWAGAGDDFLERGYKYDQEFYKNWLRRSKLNPAEAHEIFGKQIAKDPNGVGYQNLDVLQRAMRPNDYTADNAKQLYEVISSPKARSAMIQYLKDNPDKMAQLNKGRYGLNLQTTRTATQGGDEVLSKLRGDVPNPWVREDIPIEQVLQDVPTETLFGKIIDGIKATAVRGSANAGENAAADFGTFMRTLPNDAQQAATKTILENQFARSLKDAPDYSVMRRTLGQRLPDIVSSQLHSGTPEQLASMANRYPTMQPALKKAVEKALQDRKTAAGFVHPVDAPQSATAPLGHRSTMDNGNLLSGLQSLTKEELQAVKNKLSPQLKAFVGSRVDTWTPGGLERAWGDKTVNPYQSPNIRGEAMPVKSGTAQMIETPKADYLSELSKNWWESGGGGPGVAIGRSPLSGSRIRETFHQGASGVKQGIRSGLEATETLNSPRNMAGSIGTTYASMADNAADQPRARTFEEVVQTLPPEMQTTIAQSKALGPKAYKMLLFKLQSNPNTKDIAQELFRAHLNETR